MGNLKIFKAFPAYGDYLYNFYLKYPHLKQATFFEQKQALIYDAFPWIFSWSVNNIDQEVSIFETIHNCECLQKSWDNKKKYDSDWQLCILFEQIKAIQPDVCVLYPPDLFTEEVVSYIRQLIKKDVFICGYDGMDRKTVEIYNHFDLIITCSDYISEFYRSAGMNTYTLPFAFDDSVLNRIEKNRVATVDVGFSGSIYQNIHNNRYNLLKFLQKHIKIEIRSDFGQEFDYGLFSKNQLKRLLKRKNVDDYLALWRIQKSNRGSVYGLDMYQFLHDSKISLNMHGDKIKFAANVRMYEITGSGSLMLTDYKENISEIFEPEKEIITYNSFEEALDKCRFYLKAKNERVRTQIAKSGQKRTLGEYTYKRIIPKLIEELKIYIGNV